VPNVSTTTDTRLTVREACVEIAHQRRISLSLCVLEGEDTHLAPEPASVSVPTLVVTGGPLDGTTYAIDTTSREVVIGSAPDCLIRIQLGNVEPHHARLMLGAVGLVLSDAGSGSGTFVNGEKVEREHLLQSGDRVCLGPPGSKGSAKMLVLLPGATAAAAPHAPPAAGPRLVGGEASPVFLSDDHSPITIDPDAVSISEEPVIVHSAAEEPAGPPSPPPPPPPPPPAPPAPPVARASPPPAPTPPPPPPRPPAAAGPTPAPARPAAARAPEPDYQTELPSIPVERPREPAPPPARTTSRPAPKPLPRRGGGGRSLPILPVLGAIAGAVVLGGAAFWLLRPGAPTLHSVDPTRAEAGGTVTLTGDGFASQPGENTVLFGDKGGAVTGASATQLTAVVPAELAASGPVDVAVAVETKGGRSRTVTLGVYRPAKILALEPDVALPGQAVLIRGQSLAGPASVTIGGAKAQVVEAKGDDLRVAVPSLPLPEGATAPVVVTVGSETTKPVDLMIGRLPLVLEIAPRAGPIGERVVVKGRGFDASRAGNTVTFAGQPALVLAASPTELTVIAPAPAGGEGQPELPVVVTAGGRASTSPVSFNIARLSASAYVPRFFAAPVTEYPTEDLAFVSTELAPLLLFGGKADSPSTAERAVKLSATLNTLAANAATKPVAFEFRERPQPGVGVVGDVNLLLFATAEDAAAYSRPWETGRKASRRVSATALATHWAAVLQDYFGLFLYRQRPLKVLALSPRGAVLTEIFAEAARRSPGGMGVPTTVVLPTTTSMAAALKQMALVVSGEAARAGVAVVGQWEGTLEDPDSGSRRFRVRLRADGPRLAGSLTTWQGTIEVASPVRNVAFERGTLRFVANLQGAPHTFTGLLEADTVSGTVERPGRAPARFTLKFVE